ncbi:hypothetical protein [Olleya aquimaris]|uniref:DUF4136 domain-containing protein n=1 Tax=Olleya aquimaris TaxID=639310 RepID=A0A327RNY0_9FLAO|nr:hypothetical protein [Olleya aquimaris]RAJ18025.1 hypothetical protein LY08_00297 [Olleya aquimaris]
MKKTIFTLGLIASSLFVNAAELDLLDNYLLDNNNPKVVEAKTQVYQWTIKTTSGVFTGTADTFEEANKQIETLGKNTTIIEKDVTGIVLKNEKNPERVYTWGVVTDRGYATGIATSLDQAQKMVKLMGNSEVPKANIIESFKTLK